jgi:2,3-dihydroxy-p-cumate/2,3-dihydroxybenzoate 3,4-dioxygenase
MINLRDIRYCRIGVSNLDDATRFAVELLGLDVSCREPGAVYLKSDDRDHTLVYFDGKPDDHTVAFEATSEVDLDAAASELQNVGIDATHGTKDECEARHIDAMIKFRDPSGCKIEFVWKAHHSGIRYHGGRDAGIMGFSHVGLYTSNPKRDENFWTGVCSAKVSDWIGEAALLRIDNVHHKIALFPSMRGGIQHINHQVESQDDIMRSWYLMKDKGVRIVFGPGRHPTSGASFLYFEGPDGMIYEYSCGVRTITKADEEAGYRPRQFPLEPSSFCMWGSRPDIAEFKK